LSPAAIISHSKSMYFRSGWYFLNISVIEMWGKYEVNNFYSTSSQ